MTNRKKWTGVPQEKLTEWTEIFINNKEGINLSDKCPICGSINLHKYYQLGRRVEKVINGNKFIGHGGLWQWCSSCYHYEHLSAFVPEWWHDTLEINEEFLTAEPEILEKALQSTTKVKGK